MKITDAMLDQLQDAIMSLPGINTAHHSYVLVEETEGEVFLKFMSNRGLTDHENGSVLAEYLALHMGRQEFDHFDGRKFLTQYTLLAKALDIEVPNGN